MNRIDYSLCGRFPCVDPIPRVLQVPMLLLYNCNRLAQRSRMVLKPGDRRCFDLQRSSVGGETRIIRAIPQMMPGMCKQLNMSINTRAMHTHARAPCE